MLLLCVEKFLMLTEDYNRILISITELLYIRLVTVNACSEYKINNNA